MIKGFENITYRLTAEEYTIAEKIAERLVQNVGKAMAVNNTRISEYIKSLGHKVSGARIRKILNFIRTSGRVNMLIASKGGYYVTTSVVEMTDYIESLTDRIRAQEFLRASMQKQLAEHQQGMQAKLDL